MSRECRKSYFSRLFFELSAIFTLVATPSSLLKATDSNNLIRGFISGGVMRPSIPRQALHIVVRIRWLKQRTKRKTSQASNEGAPEATFLTTPIDNSEMCVLDDSFAGQYQDEAGAVRSSALGRKPVMLRFGGGRRAFASRRQQFMSWKGHAANTAVRTIRGCYTLARQELAAWRNRSKVPSAGSEGRANDIKPRRHRRVPSQWNSCNLKRPRTSSRTSGASSTSISSSLSSTTDLEEDRCKEYCCSEFMLRVRQSSPREVRRNLCGFIETTCGTHERLLLVNALSLNDNTGVDEISSASSHHLPYRTTVIDGRVRTLRNEWV